MSRSGRLFTSSTETGLLEAYILLHHSTRHAVFESYSDGDGPRCSGKVRAIHVRTDRSQESQIEALSAKKLLALQWMRCDGQILTPALAKEIEEVLNDDGVEFLKQHKGVHARCVDPTV